MQLVCDEDYINSQFPHLSQLQTGLEHRDSLHAYIARISSCSSVFDTRKALGRLSITDAGMSLGFFDSVKRFFTFGRGAKTIEIEKPQDDNHAYIRGLPDSRGPCPGLNALANMGYLFVAFNISLLLIIAYSSGRPRDGKDISIPQVEAALMTALHMTKTLAGSLSGTLKSLLHEDGTFDLRDMRRHNVLEHDISFTRLDFRQGDNYTFQPAMFQAMLDDAKGGPVTIKTLAKTYLRRKKENKESGGQGLPLRLWFVNLLQTVSLLNTAQTGGELSRELLTTFYTEERIPDVILKNQTPRTLFGLIGNALNLLFHVIF